MRHWLLLALAIGLTAPAFVVADDESAPDAAPAETEDERRERVRTCRTLTKQIVHYEEVADRARDRDNELWEQATEQQIERLEAKRARSCPEFADDGSLQAFMNFLSTAGRVAAKLFTMGMI